MEKEIEVLEHNLRHLLEINSTIEEKKNKEKIEKINKLSKFWGDVNERQKIMFQKKIVQLDIKVNELYSDNDELQITNDLLQKKIALLTVENNKFRHRMTTLCIPIEDQ